MSGEFNHNITVNKGTEGARAIPELVSPLACPGGWDRNDIPRSSPYPGLDAGLKRWHAEEDEIDAEEAREAALEEEKRRAMADTPPPPSGT